jgi:hypothetical protein
MRKEPMTLHAELALERVLHGLERELVAATDEEIAAAAAELGMDVTMKGSAAFLGVLQALPRRLEDIFDPDSLRAGHAGFLKDRKDSD